MLKENIKRFLPTVYSIFETDNKFWNLLLKKQKNKHSFVQNNQQAYPNGIPIETTPFELLDEAVKGDLVSINFLKFIDDTAKETLSKAKLKHHESIQKIIKEIFINHDVTKSRYLDSFGELLTIRVILESDIFSLDKIETEVLTGKRIDLLLSDKANENVYAEIYNIHFDKSKINSSKDAEAFFRHRIAQKIESKDIFRLPKEILENVFFFIVVWPDLITVIDHLDFIHSEDFQHMVFLTIVPYGNEKEKNQNFKFSTVDLLKEEIRTGKK